MEKNEFNNLTVSDIKAMLASGEIALQDLDVATLRRLVDHETDMLCLGEGDVELISQCSDILSERETDIMSHEDFMAVVKKTLAKQSEPVRKRFGLKRILIIAAAVAAIVIGGTLVASALGFNLFDFIGEIARDSDGVELEQSDITIQNGGEMKNYFSLKEAVEKENLNIMYPAAFPDGVEVESVQVSYSDIGDKEILVLTNNGRLILSINTNVAPTDNAFEGKELYPKDGVDYIIFENETEYKYGAYCNVNDCAYTIQAKKYEDLIYIIENMEENDK